MSGNDTLTKASLPAASLRLALEGSIGPDEAARALQDVGQKLGDQVYERLAASLRDDQTTAATGPADLDVAGFWQRLGKIFAELGWGELSFAELHPGVGQLSSHDWAEADPTSAALRPSCHCTTGMLANLLGRVANAEVGVLEVACRSRGDLECRFIFGGRAALDNIYAGLRSGTALEDLIVELV